MSVAINTTCKLVYHHLLHCGLILKLCQTFYLLVKIWSVYTFFFILRASLCVLKYVYFVICSRAHHIHSVLTLMLFGRYSTHMLNIKGFHLFYTSNPFVLLYRLPLSSQCCIVVFIFLIRKYLCFIFFIIYIITMSICSLILCIPWLFVCWKSRSAMH